MALEYLKKQINKGVAFSVIAYQTKQTSDSATYVISAVRNEEPGRDYFFGKSSSFIGVQYNEGKGFKNIITGSGVDDPGDIGKELRRWAFPKLSQWEKIGNHYVKYGATLWGHFYYPDWDDKEVGFVTGNEIFSTERTVKIDRGKNKKGSKTVQGRILGTYGEFATVTVDISLETSEVSPAKIKKFDLSQSDINEKERKIFVSCELENPENYYTLILKHGDVEIYNGIPTSEICIEIPIDREMYDSMQKFSVTVLCKNGQVEIPETFSEIYIEQSGVGVWYKDKSHTNSVEVTELWYKDSEGNMFEVSEAWVKKANQVVKTIK